MNSFQKFICILLFFTPFVLATFDAQAQTAPAWRKVCDNANQEESCRIVQQLFVSQKDKTGQERNLGRILGLNVLYVANSATKKRVPFLSIQMPLGVDLRPGAVLKVDNQAELNVKYLRCTAAGCDASIMLDSNTLNTLKAGNTLFVGFRPWGSKKTTVLKATLQGFTRALSGIK